MSAAEQGPVTCKNCETTFEGKYCPNCSQKADTHRFTVAHFGHELFHSFTHTDRGVLLLMKELLYRPGKVALEYNEGKRKKYFNPITFLLIITAIQIYVSKKTEINIAVQDKMAQLSQQAMKPNAEDAKKLDETFKDAKGKMSLVEDNNKAFNLFLIPILGGFSCLLFRKSGHNFSENLVLHTFLSGGMSLLFFVIAVVPFLLFPSSILLWMGINMIAIFIYNIIAYKQFFNQSWGKTILKGFVMFLVMMAATQLLTFVFAKIL